MGLPTGRAIGLCFDSEVLAREILVPQQSFLGILRCRREGRVSRSRQYNL
jgi:hypothetical protein